MLSPGQLGELLDDASATGEARGAAWRLRDDAVLELLYGSGLRVAEACGLDLGDLDLEGRSVTAWGKGSKQRRVPLGEPSAEALAAYLDKGRPALVAEAPTADGDLQAGLPEREVPAAGYP